MPSVQEHAERREMIRAFHKELVGQQRMYEEHLQKARLEENSTLYGGFGAGYDEDEMRARREQISNRVTMLEADIASVKMFWRLVIQVFGEPAVQLAIEEGEQRIGSIPYAW